MSDLSEIQDKPKGHQLYKSMVEYMESDDFQLDVRISSEEF